MVGSIWPAVLKAGGILSCIIFEVTIPRKMSPLTRAALLFFSCLALASIATARKQRVSDTISIHSEQLTSVLRGKNSMNLHQEGLSGAYLNSILF